MALVVEDGTGIAGANSFVSAAEVIAYAALRDVALNEQQATLFAIDAMDYIETVCFGGNALYDVPFPRAGLVLPNGDELAANIVPLQMKKAQMQLALDRSRGVVLLQSSNPEPMLKREKTGPIEQEWFAPGDSGVDTTKPNVPIASAAMAAFLCDNGKPFTLRTLRV